MPKTGLKNGISRMPLLLLLLLSISLTATAQQPTPQVVDLFNKGQDAHSHGDLDQAVKLYSQAIELNPNIYQIHYQLGVALMALKRPKEAIQSFEAAVKLKSDFAKGFNSLGEAQVECADLNGASDSFSKAIQIDATFLAAHANLGLVYIKEAATSKPNESASLNSKAREELETAYRLGAKTSRVVVALAEARAKTGDSAGAIELLGQIIGTDPNNRDLRISRATLLLGMKNYEDALVDLEAAYKIRPTADLAGAIADANMKLGKRDSAIAVLADYNHRDPKNEQIATAYTSLMIEAGRGEEIADSLKAVLAEHPKNPKLLVTVGDLYAPNHPEQAVEFYLRAYSLDQNNVDYKVKLGSALVRSKQSDKGLGLLQSAARERPDDYTVHANLATALFTLKAYGDAAVQYQWIVKARPQQAIGYYFLALSLDKQEFHEDALPAYETFLKLADPVVNKNEIEAANLRLPGLKRLIAEKKGKRHP